MRSPYPLRQRGRLRTNSIQGAASNQFNSAAPAAGRERQRPAAVAAAAAAAAPVAAAAAPTAAGVPAAGPAAPAGQNRSTVMAEVTVEKVGEIKKRAPREESHFAHQVKTPRGGFVRNGWRGKGDNKRKVEKRLLLTPNGMHRAECETCDTKGCSHELRCQPCKEKTKQAVKNARTATGVQGTTKNRKRAVELFGDNTNIDAMSTSALSKKVRRENDEVKKAELESKRAYNHRWDSYEYFKKKADKDNDADAQYAIGNAYEFGKLGLEKNEETAFQYYQKAADGGHKDAQCLIGIIYEDGSQESEEKWRKEKDGAKALEYYQKAADGGDAYAQMRLGDAYKDGMFGLEVDEVAAFEYYKKAADGGDNDAAQYEIGCAYENGELGTRNSDIPWKLDCEIRAAKAMEYYHKAADSGLTYAQYILGFHYETGLTKEGQTYASALVKKDDVKALMYYQKAADGGDDSAQLRLAKAYECATPGHQLLGLEKNEKKAIEYYSEAANGGNEDADFRLRELREGLSELGGTSAIF